MGSQIRSTDDTVDSRVLFVGTPKVDLAAICTESAADAVSVDVVADGQAALKQLTAASETPDEHQLPELVLLQLDFRLPDGQTVLQAIRASPRLEQLPVVVLDPDDSDNTQIYQAEGNAYVPLPQTPAEYTECIGSILRFWFEWARYPATCLYPDG